MNEYMGMGIVVENHLKEGTAYEMTLPGGRKILVMSPDQYHELKKQTGWRNCWLVSGEINGHYSSECFLAAEVITSFVAADAAKSVLSSATNKHDKTIILANFTKEIDLGELLIIADWLEENTEYHKAADLLRSLTCRRSATFDGLGLSFLTNPQ